MHAEARTQVTEAKKPCLCCWATSLSASFISYFIIGNVYRGVVALFIVMDSESIKILIGLKGFVSCI